MNENLFCIVKTERIGVRLPKTCLEQLKTAAEAGGYGSPCQLARCVIIRFLDYRNRTGNGLDEHADWIESLVEDHLDPKHRKRINERL